MVANRARRQGDSLRESRVMPTVTIVDNSAGNYPTENWEATYVMPQHNQPGESHLLVFCNGPHILDHNVFCQQLVHDYPTLNMLRVY